MEGSFEKGTLFGIGALNRIITVLITYFVKHFNVSSSERIDSGEKNTLPSS